MTCGADTSERPQTLREELANSICHGVALLASIAALPILITGAVRHGGVSTVIGAGVFGSTMLFLYLVSTIYHALPVGKTKRAFLVIDHCAIFLLIAGTYTPFTLGVLRGSWGWSLFGVVWGLAIFGILAKAVLGARYQGLSICLYLAMGWIVIVAAQPMLSSVPLPGLLWLLAGGLAYTIGVAFFLLDSRVRYAHFVWHLFVVAGSFFHFVAVYWYAA